MIKQRKNKTIIIAGGGTGGHIYPGLAIGREVKKQHPDIEVLFVGAVGGLEEKIVPREGFPLVTLPIGKLHRSAGLSTRLKTLFLVPWALMRALWVLVRVRPLAVLGVGGYASGPILLMASILGVRSIIWEPNAYPGLANRLLARWVDECLVVFGEASRHLNARKIVEAGLPVRDSIRPANLGTDPADLSMSQTRASSGGTGPTSRREGALRVLIFGGSQGARFLNDVVSSMIVEKSQELTGFKFVHQSGSADYDRIKKIYQKSDRIDFKLENRHTDTGQRVASQEKSATCVHLFEYLNDMDARYRWADIVICRAGASTVAEICASHKAAIFVPLPTAADDHQKKNAEVLVNKHAAFMIEQKDLSVGSLFGLLKKIENQPVMIEDLEKEVAKFKFPNAAKRIVEHLIVND